QHRRHAAAHRPAADDERSRLCFLCFGDESPLQDGHGIDPLRPGLAVGEVEADHLEAQGLERGREAEHRLVVLVAPGAVRAHESRFFNHGSLEFAAMAEQQMVAPHDPVMTGETSFIRLSHDGGKTIAERISHWRVLWSPAGQGHALFVEASLAKNIRIYSPKTGGAPLPPRTLQTLAHKPVAHQST